MSVLSTPIDLGGATVNGLERGQVAVLLAHGHLDGAAWLAEVRAGGTVQVAELPGGGAVTSVSYYENVEATVEGPPPRLVLGDFPDGFSPMDGFDWDEDLDLGDAVAAWTTCGDEDHCYLELMPDGRLMAAEIGIEDFTLDPPGLWALADPVALRHLVVVGAEVGLLVAGPIGRRGSGAGQRLWRYGARGYPGYGDDGWCEVPLDVAPDAFTDAYSTHHPVLAGHLAGRPVLYDDEGHLLDTPDIVLDDAHPQVCIARNASVGDSDTPASRGLVVALQSAEEGPELWVRGDRTWARSPLPAGRLVASTVVEDDDGAEVAWVVVDGTLHRVDLPAPPP